MISDTTVYDKKRVLTVKNIFLVRSCPDVGRSFPLHRYILLCQLRWGEEAVLGLIWRG